MPEVPLIELIDVHKQYATEAFAGVKQISFTIEKGQIVSIVGESGSGKSTLLKLIYGLLSPDSGSVSFKGKVILGPDEKLIPGHDSMRMVAQDFSLNTYAKVYDNIAGMLSNTNLQLKQEKTVQAMEFLKIDALSNKRVADLSGGEQQRVAIARAIITEPEVLLMDEPFSQVDSLLKNRLRDDVRRLSRELGITIILVSHDPADGLSLADELIILKNGQLLEKGAPEAVYNQPANLYTAQLLANCQIISGADGEKVGLKTKKKFLAIYPEWVRSANSWSGKSFIVVDCYFKGFYEELLIERNGVQLRALNVNSEQFRKGDKVTVAISRCLEFD